MTLRGSTARPTAPAPRIPAPPPAVRTVEMSAKAPTGSVAIVCLIASVPPYRCLYISARAFAAASRSSLGRRRIASSCCCVGGAPPMRERIPAPITEGERRFARPAAVSPYPEGATAPMALERNPPTTSPTASPVWTGEVTAVAMSPSMRPMLAGAFCIACSPTWRSVSSRFGSSTRRESLSQSRSADGALFPTTGAASHQLAIMVSPAPCHQGR